MKTTPEGHLYTRSPEEGTCADTSVMLSDISQRHSLQAKGTATYSEALVHILESGNITIETIQTSFTLRSAVSPDDLVYLYGAVVDSSGDMVHVGDFVEMQTITNTVSP